MLNRPLAQTTKCTTKTTITIYKLLISQNFDFGDIIYDTSFDNSSLQLERIQHNAALAIVDVVRGMSKKKLEMRF